MESKISPKPEVKKGKIFYGWWIVAAATMASALNGGVQLYGFSAFFTPLIQEFGWSRTVTSGVVSLSRLEAGVLGPITGFLIDRFGPRKLMFIGLALWGTGFLLFSRMDSLVMFYVVYVLFLAEGANLSTGAPLSTAVANWFIKKRSFALGIVLSGWGAGGMMVPVLAWVISQYGWRTAAMSAGIAVWVIGVPIAMVARHRPEQYGYLPDGETPVVSPTQVEGPSPDQNPSREINLTPAQALREPAFWFITVSLSTGFMVTSAIAVHQIPFLEDMGISRQWAALVLGLMTLISVPGRLGFGWLGDIYDKRYMLAICMAFQALGLFVFANLTSSWATWGIILYLLIFSPAYGGLRPLSGAIRAEYFGRLNFATIQGLSGFISMWANMGGPVFAGYVYDTTGSYRFAFLFFAVVNFIGIFLILLVRRPKVGEVKASS